LAARVVPGICARKVAINAEISSRPATEANGVEVASILPQTASIAARRAFESTSFWGEAGRHARAAPGVAALPLDTPVVVKATVEVST
jgi:hypothetical protein